ncbi:hypothetical protein OG909_16905 [Streptomyces sp. NBC_01754]|uniref:hypothetical protein n=1 Tax=Streptomyces sp. NBC_01754 TaxID=2975930 RepID=UPI002DD8040B|nr:hypothetical protein [Streptomyces sp. NBC_01754]WSC93818.1 hypothetical protein OG909_16905 [Streptomyces sp. NBC_01754]
MSATRSVEELGARSARARALALLRVRSRAVALAVVPAAVAVVLLVANAQGRIGGAAWDTARWAVTGCAVVVLLLAAAVTVAVARARPAVSPTVPLTEEAAPGLYRLVRELANRLEVPAPSAVALTPDCDSWLEDRTHPAARPKPPDLADGPVARRRGRRAPDAPVLVIGSPFMWWMRVAELRAVLAPVVAGTGPSAHPDIAAARRFVRGLDAAVADASTPGQGVVRKIPSAFVGWVSGLLLRGCRTHAAEMERCVAAAASVRAQAVDYGLRIAAQEQVGLAYAGWDRLLTRVALPAWRMGRWPSRLDAGVVSALTELSRRDRLAESFTSRLGERPACDLIEEPGTADEAASLLAARLFHGGPAQSGPGWSPVDWQHYPQEVVDRKWRTEAARLHQVLDAINVAASVSVGTPAAPVEGVFAGHTLARVIDHLAPAGRRPGQNAEELARELGAAVARDEAADAWDARPGGQGNGPSGALGAKHGTAAAIDPLEAWGLPLPLFPLQPPRTDTELLTDHVAAMVCCAAVDTAGAAPGLDWLDGPVLLVDGSRRSDLGGPVLSLVEDGDAEPLRSWLSAVGVRADRPVRLAEQP